MQNVPRDELIPYFLGLIIGFGMRAIILWAREKIGFQSGQLLRNHIRQKILDKIHLVGPATINQKPAGSWASIMLEQVENLHNFYARFSASTKSFSHCSSRYFNCCISVELGCRLNLNDYRTACSSIYDHCRYCCS